VAGEPAATPSTEAVREIPTPDDIVVLRRTDPAAALEWRRRLRADLGGALAAGCRITGFTRAGAYVVEEG
jgi:hypothetical protein